MQLSSGNYAVQDSTLSNLCNYKYIRASAIQDSSYKNAGYGLDQMNWPVGVSTDGTRLYVADAHNNRILVWNSLPTKSGQAADWVINMIDSVGSSPLDRELYWP